MSVLKQFLVIVVLAGAAIAGAAAWVPAARPLLERAGLAAPLMQMGLLSAEAAIAPAGQGAGGQGGGGQGAGGQGAGGQGGGGQAPVVFAAPVAERAMSDVVAAIGTGRGARSVIVSAELTGRITDLPVQPGQQVTEGQVLARLDDEAARIARDRAAVLLSDAQATWDRVSRLQSSGTATDIQVNTAAVALKTAELNLREAELTLQRHAITAPIAGWAGILPVEPGDRVVAGDEIVRIEDRSSLLVDFRVPERVVSRLSVGDVLQARAMADPATALQGRISALDNRLDEASRSLAVQAAIPNAEDRLRAGMAFSIELAFTGETRPTVDPLAIQWSSRGPFVWVLRDGAAAQQEVRILQRSPDAVLVDAAFLPGDLVVTEGMQNLRPGAPATVAPASAPAAGTAPAATN